MTLAEAKKAMVKLLDVKPEQLQVMVTEHDPVDANVDEQYVIDVRILKPQPDES